MTEQESRTFDFGGNSVEDSTFEDIESSADRIVVAGGGRRNRFADVRHKPSNARWSADQAGGWNWSMIGAVAGVAGVVVALVFGLIAIF